MSDDDGFVFGDDEDESLFGSSETTENDPERRFGTADRTDSSSTGRTSLGGTTKTVATVVLAAVLVVVAGAVAYPLVMGAFDSGPTEGRAPSDGGGSASVSTPTTPTGPPVTQIVMTVEETTNVSPATQPATETARSTRTTRSTATESPATMPATTDRTTVPVNEFPAGDPADENETAAA
jgi:hypothetical protein